MTSFVSDKFRNNKVMVNFPADVTKAEELTKGNVNILKTFESPAKPKASPVKPHTESSPAVVSKKAAGEYNTSSKVQLSVSAEPKSDKKFACSKCNFSTDRINLLMFHIKTHSSAFPSRVSGKFVQQFLCPLKCSLKNNLDPSPTIEVKKPVTTKSPAKKAPVADDSIADDVRKIKESMKPKPVAKKVAKEQVKATATPGRPRTVKKEVVKEPVVVKVEEKPKPVNELKNELLADWMDDDDEIEKPPKIEGKFLHHHNFNKYSIIFFGIQNPQSQLHHRKSLASPHESYEIFPRSSALVSFTSSQNRRRLSNESKRQSQLKMSLLPTSSRRLQKHTSESTRPTLRNRSPRS